MRINRQRLHCACFQERTSSCKHRARTLPRRTATSGSQVANKSGVKILGSANQTNWRNKADVRASSSCANAVTRLRCNNETIILSHALRPPPLFVLQSADLHPHWTLRERMPGETHVAPIVAHCCNIVTYKEIEARLKHQKNGNVHAPVSPVLSGLKRRA